MTYREYHVVHVLLNCPLIFNDSQRLRYTLAFSSQNCLIDAEATGRDRYQPTISRDTISDRDGDYISWDQFRCVHFSHEPPSQGLCFLRRIFLESLEVKIILASIPTFI
jgi:hypothetical protein